MVLDSVVQSEYGPEATVADWLDFKGAVGGDAAGWLAGSGLNGSAAYCLYNGKRSVPYGPFVYNYRIREGDGTPLPRSPWPITEYIGDYAVYLDGTLSDAYYILVAVPEAPPPPPPPPVAAFTITPESPKVGDSIKLDASASTGEQLQYDWVVGGELDTAEGVLVDLEALNEGRIAVRLTVTDSLGRKSTIVKPLYVAGVLPNGLDTSLLKPGDLLFRRTADRFYGYFSHVGMYVEAGLIIDAELSDGTQIRNVSDSFGHTDIWAVGRVFSPGQAAIALDSASQWIGVRYGIENILESVMYRFRDYRNNTSWGIYCSQLVWLAGMDAGVDLDADFNTFNRVVTPDEIFHSVYVDKIQASLGRKPSVISDESPVDLVLVDGFGRRSGTDPETGETMQDIPGVFYHGPDETVGPEQPLRATNRRRARACGHLRRHRHRY